MPERFCDAKLKHSIDIIVDDEIYEIVYIFGEKKTIICSDGGVEIPFCEIDKESLNEIIYEIMLWLSELKQLKLSEYKDIILDFINK